jgi:hypothetical protein
MTSLSAEYLDFKLQKSMYLHISENFLSVEAFQYCFTTLDGESTAHSFCGGEEAFLGLILMAREKYCRSPRRNEKEATISNMEKAR